MQDLFKQLWPIIKSKVREPELLLKTISSISGGSINASELLN
jgi:hypothetical protein